MPIYEYQCNHCHHAFDLIQKISDAPVKECPECHKEAVVRLVSPAGFQLKGTGWYATDFKDKGKKKPEVKKEEGASSTAETKSTEAKTDTKKGEKD